MKGKIISNTLLFIFIVIFIVAFKIVFGDPNTLVAVTTITAMLMFLQRDLTATPIKNTFKLVALNLFIGIAAIIATSNMWIAIPVNFITMFILSYSLCSSLRNPMYLPFSLQYLFILANPVSGNEVYVRLVALVVGALLIMALQLLVNRNKVTKSGNKILTEVCDNLLKEINLIKESKDITECSTIINKSLGSFRDMIHDKREEDYYLTEEGRVKLNLIVALEKINIHLRNINDAKQVEEILSDTYSVVEEAKEYFRTDKLPENIYNNCEKILEKYEKNNETSTMVLDILNSIVFLVDTVVELSNLEKKNYNTIYKLEGIPKEFKNSLLDIKNLKNKSLKFSYAIKVSVGITLAAFIMNYFNLEEGRWIMFTILSLVTPLYEMSKRKYKARILATVIGAIIIMILFTVFTDDISRMLILMLSGYIGNYIPEYKYNMICVTVSAVGAAILSSGNTTVVSIERILFVVLGLILAILINKFIYPYKIEDSIKDLSSMYRDVIKKMIKEVIASLNGVNNTTAMNNLFITSSLIEDKIMLNNQALNDVNTSTILMENRLLVSSVYQLYISVVKGKIDKKDLKVIIKNINELLKDRHRDVNEVIDRMKNGMEAINDINDKLIITRIVEILGALEQSKNGKVALANNF